MDTLGKLAPLIINVSLNVQMHLAIQTPETAHFLVHSQSTLIPKLKCVLTPAVTPAISCKLQSQTRIEPVFLNARQASGPTLSLRNAQTTQLIVLTDIMPTQAQDFANPTAQLQDTLLKTPLNSVVLLA